jgi:hypothetical protein
MKRHAAIVAGTLLLMAAGPLDLRASCGAVGDGVADDSAALKSCLTRLQAELDTGQPSSLRIPSGIYRITGASGPMPTLTRRGSALIGDGPHQSIFVLDKSYAGDLFSWSETWLAETLSPTAYPAARDASGATISGLQITGDTTAPAVQNAFTFYDRNDNVLMRDIEIDDLGGQCLSTGRTRTVPLAYLRESAFFNLKCFKAGTTTLPAIELSSTTAAGSDATNELDFYKLAVFAAKGTGVAIRNPNPFSATRGIRFFGLRIEQLGGDGLAINTQADQGQVAGIGIYDLTVIQSQAAAIHLSGAKLAPYQISIRGGSLGPGNHTGIAIDRGRQLAIDLDFVDAPIILGPAAGNEISILGNGSEHQWPFSGRTAQPLAMRSEFGLYGLPHSGERVGAAALQATTSTDAPVRLTMDGTPPNATNCFNPTSGQAFNLDIRLIARDASAPEKRLAWTLPLGVLAVAAGPATATWQAAAPPTQSGTAGASVEVTADKQNGCLSLAFVPPPGNHDRWDATASIAFARTP